MNGELLLIKPHYFDISANGLGSLYVGPAVAGNVPGAVDQG